ncbi:1892_t:CDS:2, partial [Scutellospora calospora]
MAIFLYDIFVVFGAPLILQSDNGKEFTAELISELMTLWPGVRIINGRPRHSQSQGLVERANGILQVKLGKWMEDNSTNNWTEGLPLIIRICPTGKSPYSLVFGQDPIQHFSILEDLNNQNIVDEEELPDNFFEDTNNVSTESLSPSPTEISSSSLPEPSSSIPFEPSSPILIESLSPIPIEPSSIIPIKSSSSIPLEPSSLITIDLSSPILYELSSPNLLEPSLLIPINSSSLIPFELSLPISFESSLNSFELSPSPKISKSYLTESSLPNLTMPKNNNSHQLYREYANKSLDSYRDRMKNQMLKKNKHKPEYSINKYVCIAVPKIDRNHVDRHTLPCKVIEELPDKMYRLQCKNGILD